LGHQALNENCWMYMQEITMLDVFARHNVLIIMSSSSGQLFLFKEIFNKFKYLK